MNLNIRASVPNSFFAYMLICFTLNATNLHFLCIYTECF